MANLQQYSSAESAVSHITHQLVENLQAYYSNCVAHIHPYTGGFSSRRRVD